MIRLPILASLALLITLAPVARGEEKDAPKGERVFIAGHSFHIPIASTLTEIAKAAGIEHKLVGQQMIGGSSVSQHWNLPDAANKAKKALNANEVDVLTVSPNILIPDEAIDKFTALLLQHNPAGRVTIQVSWVPRDGRLIDRTFKLSDRDKAKGEELRVTGELFANKVREQAKAINDQYAQKLKRQVAFVVPVGEAVTLLREKVAAGQAPGVTKQSELFRDELGHGREAIYVLNAYCHYAVIYGRSPVGLPVPAALAKGSFGDNTAKLNTLLQEIAWKAVTSEPASGVTAVAAKKEEASTR